MTLSKIFSRGWEAIHFNILVKHAKLTVNL